MKTSLTLFALAAACVALTACGGSVADAIETDSAELTGVEPDEIDYDDDEAAVGSANGGVWKSSNFGPSAAGGAAGTVNRAGTGGGSARGVTYGPVITIKPKG